MNPTILGALTAAVARLCWAFLITLFGMGQSAWSAHTPEVERGLSWLTAQVQADGSLGGEGVSLAAQVQARSEAERTIRKLSGQSHAVLVGALIADPEDNAEFLSRKLLSADSTNAIVPDLLNALLLRQNADGGFGGDTDFASNVIDTAWGLLALNGRAGYSTNVASAVSFLLSRPSPDGSFTLDGTAPSVYASAFVLAAVQGAPGSSQTAGMMDKLAKWLTAQQRSDGGWGTVDETSLAYLSLVGVVSDAGLQARVADFLMASQDAAGSWSTDPYVTALALRALVARPATASPGTVTGRAVSAHSDLALSGATVTLSGATTTQTTGDANGGFAFAGLPAGSYTLGIAAPGFVPVTQNFYLQAGSVFDAGVVQLVPDATTGVLFGQVLDGTTGQPLDGVLIEASGAVGISATTQADGTFQISNLAPGLVTVAASKSGYQSVTGTGEIVAGHSLRFSPSLVPTGSTPPSMSTLIGKVVDAATLAPLAGVAISAGSGGGATGLDGSFAIPDIAAGTYSVTFSLAGYSPFSASVLVAAGATMDFRTVALAKLETTVSVIGRVTDAQTARPIANARISVDNGQTVATTTATGDYEIGNLSVGSHTLAFSAPGYTPVTFANAFASPGRYRVDRALSAEQGQGIGLTVTTGAPSYAAFRDAEIRIEARNLSSDPSTGRVQVSISGPDGSVLSWQEAVWIDADKVAHNLFDIPPATTIPVSAIWNTVSYPPGTYTVTVKFITDSSVYTQSVVAQRSATFEIAPTQSVLGLTIKPVPGFTNYDATENVSFAIEASNHSNMPTSVEFSYVLADPAGVALYQGSYALEMQPVSMNVSVSLPGLTHHFLPSGIYPLSATVTGGAMPENVVSGQISVAPGTRIDPSQSLAPQQVTPDGDKRIRVRIQLKGVEQK